jgi:hypothetical protein
MQFLHKSFYFYDVLAMQSSARLEGRKQQKRMAPMRGALQYVQCSAKIKGFCLCDKLLNFAPSGG